MDKIPVWPLFCTSILATRMTRTKCSARGWGDLLRMGSLRCFSFFQTPPSDRCQGWLGISETSNRTEVRFDLKPALDKNVDRPPPRVQYIFARSSKPTRQRIGWHCLARIGEREKDVQTTLMEESRYVGGSNAVLSMLQCCRDILTPLELQAYRH
jgi:hypothetical protein